MGAPAARRERAEVKDALKHGRPSLREVLEHEAEAIRKMPVRTLLESLPILRIHLAAPPQRPWGWSRMPAPLSDRRCGAP